MPVVPADLTHCHTCNEFFNRRCYFRRSDGAFCAAGRKEFSARAAAHQKRGRRRIEFGDCLIASWAKKCAGFRAWAMTRSVILFSKPSRAKAWMFRLSNATKRAPTGIFFRQIHAHFGPQVFYFRAGSAASKIGVHDVNETWFSGARHLHVTGITPALSA